MSNPIPDWFKASNLKSEHGFGHARSLSLSGNTKEDFFLPTQKHTNRILMLRNNAHITQKDFSSFIADGVITDLPDIKVGVVTADCAPILLQGITHENTSFVGAIHAGWRGAIGGIIENIKTALDTLNVKEWHAAVGPCAGESSYEVNHDFQKHVLELRPDAAPFFRKQKSKGPLFNLQGWCVCSLEKSGASSVEAIPFDTISDQNFFSYRRGTLESKVEKGRQITWIKHAKS